MNVKKAVKRIAALAAGATMVAATIAGATAMDLSNYPAPFIQNGVFNGKIVIGKTAKVSDVLGAIDIAASLQAAAKTPVSTGGSTQTVTVDGGVEIKQGSTDLNLGDTLNSLHNSGRYSEDDFPTLLKSGTLEDNDGTDYDYDQYLYVGNAQVKFGQDDKQTGDDPNYYLDWDGASSPYLTFEVDFDDDVNVSALTDSEQITMFGKTYTFDANNKLNGDLTMYGSDTTVTVSQDQPATVQVNGKQYTIEVLGGNSDDSTAIIRVTSDSGQATKSLSAGSSKTMAGLDLYVSDVFISNIGANTISASIFVGSNKIVIPSSAVSTTASYKEVEINGESSTKVYAWVKSHSDGNLGDVDAIYFRFDLTDFDNPRTSDNWKWMIPGDKFTDTLFGFSLYFDGYTPSLDGRNEVEFKRTGGDTYTLDFTNNNGDDYSVDLYQYKSGSLTYGDDLVLSGTTLEDNDIFFLEEDGVQRSDAVTKAYEVTDIDGTNDEVTLKDLGTGVTKTYKSGDQIGDATVPGSTTAVTISSIDSNDANFTLSSSVLSEVVFKGGANLTLDTNLSDGYANLTYYEDSDDVDEATAGSFNFAFYHDSSNNDDDIVMTIGTDPWGANGEAATDTDGNVEYAVSDFGTWVEAERDNSGDYLKILSSETETKMHVFLEGPNAVVTTAAPSGTAYKVNDMVVGQIAVFDDEAASLLGNTPLIVVGGPCVNTVAMDLMGNPSDCTEGFTAGKGKIKFFSDKNAVLVAGYSGQDTIGASYVLADYKKYHLSGDEVEVTVTDLNHIEVQSVA